MPKPLRKVQLDQLTARYGCGEHRALTLSGQCHPDGTAYVIYPDGSGIIRLECSVCRNVIVEIEVAD